MCAVRSIFCGVALSLLTAAAVPGQTHAIDGLVFDPLSGRPLAGASVVLLSRTSGDTVAAAISGPMGAFRLEAPAGRYRLVGWKADHQTAEMELRVPGDATGGLMIVIEPLDPAAVTLVARDSSAPRSPGPARILGRLLDAETSWPVEGAEVSIAAGVDTARAVSDVNGFVVLDEVPPEGEVLVVRHLAYGEQGWPVELDPGTSYRFDIAVEPQALAIEGITVTSRASFERWRGLTGRLARGMGGHFILAEELERRSHPPLYTALTSAPSVQVRKFGGPFNQRIWLRGCKASLFIDGVEVFNPADDRDGEPPQLAEFLRIATVDVKAIEIYPGAATLPPEFNNPGTFCAVAVWTRRGG